MLFGTLCFYFVLFFIHYLSLVQSHSHIPVVSISLTNLIMTDKQTAVSDPPPPPKQNGSKTSFTARTTSARKKSQAGPKALVRAPLASTLGAARAPRTIARMTMKMRAMMVMTSSREVDSVVEA